VDLTAYRILQEALTNALRHSPGAHVDARVRVTAADVVVEVTNTGGRHVPARPDTGRGLAGMRERAHAHGGEVSAGPADGGFTVRARLPLAAPVPVGDGVSG
jgi:signal transduction histidine kinase